MNLIPQQRFTITVRRDSDTKMDNLYLSWSAFLSDYSFDTWIHMLFTYKFDSATSTSDMELYMNGKANPNVGTGTGNWAHPNNNTNDGRFVMNS